MQLNKDLHVPPTQKPKSRAPDESVSPPPEDPIAPTIRTPEPVAAPNRRLSRIKQRRRLNGEELNGESDDAIELPTGKVMMVCLLCVFIL